MPTAHLGRKNEPATELVQSPDLLILRTLDRRPLARTLGAVALPMPASLDPSRLVVSFPEAGVEVYRMTPAELGEIEGVKRTMRSRPDIRFAGRVLVDPISKQPVVYTENVFIKFMDDSEPGACEAAIRDHGLAIKEKVEYAKNAYFAAAPEGTGQKVFEIAERLLQREDVEYCHPELIRRKALKSIPEQQWHLGRSVINGNRIDAHANVEAAHAVTMGEGVTIAIIDDGVDIDHLEFSPDSKVVAPKDIMLDSDDARPKDRSSNHGTSCAGVACASGLGEALGVAPRARLMPIRLMANLGSKKEADAFTWAAQNGADVISCSWGPSDGAWWDLNDPTHDQHVPMGAMTKLAIDDAVRNGRNGKGCVILFAAGNGNERVDNDGYASYDKVIAVAACNDRGTRSVYSDHGKAVWCSFPSNDMGHPPFNHPDPLTTGIWTTDRVGRAGYNPGSSGDGDAQGNYTNSFGGTSSACPGAAGVAALVLAVAPGLKWNEVRAILGQTCDKIDMANGAYDASGRSEKYGHGRLNAARAVELAQRSVAGS